MIWFVLRIPQESLTSVKHSAVPAISSGFCNLQMGGTQLESFLYHMLSRAASRVSRFLCFCRDPLSRMKSSSEMEAGRVEWPYLCPIRAFRIEKKNINDK